MDSIGLPLRRTDIAHPEPSPFDYDDHALLYVPTPNSSLPRQGIYAAAAQTIENLVQLTEGRTLVLFTAKQDMNAVYRLLKKSEGRLPCKLLLHTNQGGQDKEFIQDEHSVLFSTGLWEGLDVRGPSLSSLIIFKLPYPVPDPIYNYKVAMVGERDAVYVPEMLVRLRQGLGRLIRHETDRGLAVILDRRMPSQHLYKHRQQILDAIPFKTITESITDVELFVRHKIL